MEASVRCLQGLGCVCCAKSHESCQLQLIPNFYYPCKYYPKSRSLNSTLSSFQALQPQSLTSLNCSVSSFQVLQTTVYVFNPSPSFFQVLQSKIFISLNSYLYPSGTPIETLRLSTHLSPPFGGSKWNYMSVHSSFSFFPSGDSDTKIFILTSKYTWHMSSRCYVSVLHLITIISSICHKVAIRLVSLNWRYWCQMSAARR